MSAVEIVELLLRVNLAGGAAILGVIALRKAARRRFGARLAYGLWLLPILASAAVMVPARQIVVVVHPVARAIASVPATAAAQVRQAAARTAPAAAAASLDPRVLLLGAWLTGVAIAALVMALLQLRFVRQARLGGVGPAVVGVIAPRIITPGDFAERYSAAERTLVLAHEQAHIARQDSRLNGLSAAIQCLCWFNPLVHLAARLMRIDQELACDEAVTVRFPDARRAYAEVLLKAQLAAPPLPLGCYWPSRAQHPLVERVAMLKRRDIGPARRYVGAAALASLCAGTSLAAWATQPADVRVRFSAVHDSEASLSPPEIVVRHVSGSAPKASSSVDLASAPAPREALQREEEQSFQAAVEGLRQTMQDMPELAEPAHLSRQIQVDETPEGLRIQLIDQEGAAMFDQGSSKPNERARLLLRAVARAVNPLPNRLTITDHTTASADGKKHDEEWTLSFARADAARQILQEDGVNASRVYQVSGRGASDPLYPDNPALAGNSRIAVVLMRRALAGANSAAAPQPAPPAARPEPRPIWLGRQPVWQNVGPAAMIKANSVVRSIDQRWATFTGDVVFTLGDDRLNADRLEIETDPAPRKGGVLAFKAEGGVLYTLTGGRVEADSAVYDPASDTIVFKGGVVFHHGQDEEKSETLTLDRRKGVSVLQPGSAPSTESLLLHWIAAVQMHQTTEAVMSPALIEAARQQAGTAAQIFRAFGALQRVRFVRAMPDGVSNYEADFAHGKLNLMVGPLTADGKLDQLRFGPIWAKDGERPRPGVPLAP